MPEEIAKGLRISVEGVKQVLEGTVYALSFDSSITDGGLKTYLDLMPDDKVTCTGLCYSKESDVLT